MLKLVAALALVVAFASGVWADKIITRFTVTLTDVQGVCFVRDTQASTGWVARANATVRASDGTAYPATIAGPVTAGQKATIETYISNNVLTPLNTQEGL